MLSNLLHTGRRRTKDESICKLDYDIAAGIHSTTASEFRLFPQLTNSWLLTTDYTSTAAIIVAVWSTAAPYKRHGSRRHQVGTHLLSGVLSE